MEIERGTKTGDAHVPVSQKAPGCVGDAEYEDRLRSVVRNALSLAGIDLGLVPELPVRDGFVAEAIGKAEGLVLFEVEFVWAFCRAIACGGGTWKGVLVPPFHERTTLITPSTKTDGREVVRVRGWETIDPEAWSGHVSAEERFAKILATALVQTTDRFAGMIRDADELVSIAEGGPVSQVRIVSRPASWATIDPVGELQSADALWIAGRSLGRRGVDIVAWQCDEANGRGYDLCHLRGDSESLSGLEYAGLREVIRLPEEEAGQLFIWYGTHACKVAMTVMGDGRDRTVDVPAAELGFRLDYTPGHYLDCGRTISMATVGNLVRRVQRGTSVNGKSLQVVGTTGDPRPGASFDWATLSYHSDDDLYYVDNASISWGSVKPRVISEMPAGQERYTVTPASGKVLLVARNGKGLACYEARRPTLVSNNLFIVWPDERKVTAEYLSCAMRSAPSQQQMQSMRMPMGRADLESILVPIGPKSLMDDVVERELQIERERSELTYRLQMLDLEEPLDRLWADSSVDEECKEFEEGRGGER